MGWFDCFWGTDVRNFRKRMEALLEVMKEDMSNVQQFARQFDAESRGLRMVAKQCLAENDEVGLRTAVRDALNKKHLREKAMRRYDWLSDKQTQMYGMYMSRSHHENDKYYVSGMRKLARNEDIDTLERAVDDVEVGIQDFEELAQEIKDVIDQPFDARAFAVVQEYEIEEAMATWFNGARAEPFPAQAAVAETRDVPVLHPEPAAAVYHHDPQPTLLRAQTDANDEPLVRQEEEEDEDSPGEGPTAPPELTPSAAAMQAGGQFRTFEVPHEPPTAAVATKDSEEDDAETKEEGQALMELALAAGEEG